MTDITKCRANYGGYMCCLHTTCWRFLAPETGLQSWFAIAPWNPNEGGDKCDSYWPAKVMPGPAGNGDGAL